MVSNRRCSVPDCCGVHQAHGYCNKHYLRWRTHGDPLFTVIAAHGDPMKFVTEVALKWETDDCLTWPYGKNGRGYGTLKIGLHKTSPAHRLICEMAHGEAPSAKHEAAHSCGKGHEGCVSPRHLRWATPQENTDDKRAHGTILMGEQAHNAKLKTVQVKAIRLLKGKLSNREIGEAFGINANYASKVANGQRWKFLKGGDA